MFGAKILTKIYAKSSKVVCPAISKMSSKTIDTTLNVSNDDLILKVYAW